MEKTYMNNLANHQSAGLFSMAGFIDIFRAARDTAGLVYFIGNGGSAGIAMHMTADFLKNGKMRTVSMYNPATLTCLGNDFGIEYIFSKQLELLVRPGDLLVAISSSGNSPNILRGIEAAKDNGAQVITLTGFCEDNKARQMGDFNIYVPSMEYGIVESVHNIILQQAVDMLMRENEEEENA
ncbi:MAG: SIS domain-containing protein [Schwartzia sp.]|nr:SIS domain-containing protein [Schwartzia sp. (in: firmicutes)]